MSAFILLAANSNANAQHQKQLQRRKVKKRANHDRASSSHKSSMSSSGDSSLKRYNTEASLASSNSNPNSMSNISQKSHNHKKVYDVNKNAYVDRDQMLSPMEKRIKHYEQTYEKIVMNSQFHHLTEKLNTCQSNLGTSLFSIENLSLLRYSYFKQFNGDYESVSADINEKDDLKKPKLKFVSKIEKLNKRNSHKLSSHKDILTSDDESDEDEMAKFAKSINIGNDNDEGIFQEYSTFKSNQDNGASFNIRSLMNSKQFWNNIYQDLKFMSIQLNSSINYFELLPSINQSQTFFCKLLEFFLYNIQYLTITNFHDIKEDEIKILKSYSTVYFQDFNYDLLLNMGRDHHKMYSNQTIMNNNLSSPISLSFSFEKSDSTYDDSRIHRRLMENLIETLIENFKRSLNLPNVKYQHNQNDQLFDLWKDFLNFIIFDIIIEEYEIEKFPEPDILSEDDYPEPTIDDLTHFNNTITHLHHPQPIIPKQSSVQLKRNTSISSRSISLSNQSIISSPRSKNNHHKGSITSNISSSNNSFNGHNQNYQSSLTSSSPISTHFEPNTPDFINSIENQNLLPSKSKNSINDCDPLRPSSPLINNRAKKLIFSKFRK